MIDAPTDENVATEAQTSGQGFTLLDAMVLIAATAVGLTVVRYSQMRYFEWQEPLSSDRIIYYTLAVIGRPVYGILPILYGICVAVVATGLRSARPRRQELTMRPGIAACAAAIVSLSAALVVRLLSFAAGNPGVLWSKPPLDVLLATADRYLWSPQAIDALFMDAGVGSISAVMAVWTLQRLCGLWHPVPEWPDRLGRAVGWLLLLWALTPH